MQDEQPYDKEDMTSRQKLTALILSGIQRSANYGSIDTYGDLFMECERFLNLVTFKDECEE